MKKILLSAGLAALLLVGCNSGKEFADSQIGIRADIINDDINTPSYNTIGNEPGSGNVVFERSFENAPPFIPHSLDGLLPITTDNNSCLNCHIPDVAEGLGTKAAPASHTTDLRTNKDLKGVVSQSRFNCTACHVGQTDAPAIGTNSFKPDFRQESDKSSSNLLDVINQGI